ncbi:MAG: type VII secretion protein EssC [Chloroflexota bacterium]|nr:type VII secretion protein EssC [Chloroflexota bacterium]
MATSPTVLLSPRTPVRLPSLEIDIPPPPPAPSKPSGSLVYQVLPVVLAAVGMGIILMVGNIQTSGSTMLVLLAGSLLLVGGGAGVSVMMHRAHNSAYQRGTRERIERYSRMLISTRDRVQQLLIDQRELLLDKDPDPGRCARVAMGRAPRLWERSPDDPDFLILRVGLGSQPSSVPVRAPRQPDPLLPDPLIDAADELAAWGNSVWGVPVFVPLVDGRAAGVCGPRGNVLETARALIVQLATHHAPDEVKLVALVPPAEAAEWAWLRWLPHTWSDDRRERYFATTPGEASSLSKRLEEVLTRRRDAASSYGFPNTSSTRPKAHLPVYVFLVADETLADSMPVLAGLDVSRDSRLGASCLFLSTDRTRLPRSCRTILEVPGGVLTQPNGDVHSVACLDGASPELARQLASALAPVRARRIASSSALPVQVPLLDLLGVERVEELDLLDRWRRRAPDRSLGVPIGVRPGGETLWLDLHQTADGPHGLIAGSTGSGKSALMQALLLGLAASFHPHDLALVLVDYKGGSTAGPLRELPHLVGTITNLDGNLARRALVALQAEIERRQALLSAAGCDDLDAYLGRRRLGQALEPLPHLVLVVDEFAELKTERPDFIHQLVRTARVGRNVGLHLILATQKPRPAVDDEIWANARFRVCLRVEQPQDSQDVLKRPDAVSLAGRGQGYLQVGHDEIFTLFQGAWGGAVYHPESAATDPREIVLVDLDGTRRAIDPIRSNATPSRDPTQAEALAGHVRRAADQAGIARLSPIWLAPLREGVVLTDVLDVAAGWDGSGWRPSGRWMEPAIGVVDDPAHRRQSPLRIDLPRGGNLAVYGAPGAGKTTALLALALALACEHPPADLNIYLLDFGGHVLGSLSALPHVGGVVLGDEEEKLVRLLRHLSTELSRRKALFAEAGVATLPAYRAATEREVPALVLLIDNLPALMHTYADLEDEVAQIAQQGGTLGVHLVFSAASPTLVRLRIANSFSQAVTLRLADRADYSAVLSVPEGYEPSSQPGRGLIKGRPTLEFQVALPAGGASEADQTAGVRRLTRDMDAAWLGPRPWRVRTLPEHVSLLDVLPGSVRVDGMPIGPVGLAEDELEPLYVDLRDGPHFVIGGPPRGGKSTLMRTWILGLIASLPRDRLRVYLADFSHAGLNGRDGLPGVRMIHDGAELVTLLDEIESAADVAVARVLAIDDLDGLQRSTDSGTLDRLQRLVRARRSGVHVLLVGSSSSLGASYEGFGHAIKETQTGFLVGGSDYEDLQVLGINVPHAEARQGLPAGRAFYARRKRYVRVKVAEPPDAAKLAAWAALVSPSGGSTHFRDLVLEATPPHAGVMEPQGNVVAADGPGSGTGIH